jgi:allantoate deiminase
MTTLTELPALAGAHLEERLRAIAACTDVPGEITRLTLSPAHARAAALVAGWMEQAGLRVRMTPLGDVVGRLEGTDPAAGTLLMGSHLDSVRNAGRYDGPLGVVAALAVVEAAAALGQRWPFAIEVLAFADEEGVRFPSSLTGSRAAAGHFDPAWLLERDSAGISRAEALRAFGAPAGDVAAEARDPAAARGYLEVHIEQGPVLEASGLALGVVTGIQGNTRARLHVRGEAGHAGTLPMAMRHDALAAAAEMVLLVEAHASAGPELIATVGDVRVPGGAINVVAGEVMLTLDVRSPDDATRHAGTGRILAGCREIAEQRGVRLEVEMGHDAPAAPCDAALQEALAAAMLRQGALPFRMASGAGHDAMAFRGRIPAAMLFVRCRGGISHNPAEFASGDDMGLAARVLYDAVAGLAGLRRD